MRPVWSRTTSGCTRSSSRGRYRPSSNGAARERHPDPGSCASGGRGAAASPLVTNPVLTGHHRDESGGAPVHGRLLRGGTPSTLQASSEACGMKDSQRPGICATLEACEAPMPCGSLCRHTSGSTLTRPSLSISTSSRRSWRSSGGRRSSGAHSSRSSRRAQAPRHLNRCDRTLADLLDRRPRRGF